jgi:hypothetical protein
MHKEPNPEHRMFSQVYIFYQKDCSDLGDGRFRP